MQNVHLVSIQWAELVWGMQHWQGEEGGGKAKYQFSLNLSFYLSDQLHLYIDSKFMSKLDISSSERRGQLSEKLVEIKQVIFMTFTFRDPVDRLIDLLSIDW